MELGDDERANVYVLLRKAQERVRTGEAVQAALLELFHWALGEGPLPRDEEAERAALAYLWAASRESFGVMWPFAKRVWPLLPKRLEWPDELSWEPPAMPWSEALRRLEDAAQIRRAMVRTKEAMRRGVAGDRIGMIRALRGAVDAFGEPRASAPVELQWRAAELEVEARELERAKGVTG